MSLPNVTKSHPAFETMAAVGNCNHWGHWIRSLEAMIECHNEHRQALTLAPCYVSWLLMKSEFVFYLMRLHLYANSKLEDDVVFDANYKALIKGITPSAPSHVLEDIQLALQIRHLLIHKGFPNPHEAPLANGRAFGRKDFADVRSLIISPRNYSKIKARLDTASRWLDSNTSAFSTGF